MGWIPLSSVKPFEMDRATRQRLYFGLGEFPPLNIVNPKDVESYLNWHPKLINNEKLISVTEVYGYYPDLYEHWSRNKVYLIEFLTEGLPITDSYDMGGSLDLVKENVVGKVVDPDVGISERSVQTKLFESGFPVPEPRGLSLPTAAEDEEILLSMNTKPKSVLWMDYINSKYTFEKYMLQLCLGEEKINSSFREISDIIMGIWDLGFAHGDLKGEHILRTKKDNWVVIDLGEAKEDKYSARVGDLYILITDTAVFIERHLRSRNLDEEALNHALTDLADALTQFLEQTSSCVKRSLLNDVWRRIRKEATILSDAFRNIVVSAFPT
jgi:tRNA A-37 threonylcarbamoyl transferase component Bud32